MRNSAITDLETTLLAQQTYAYTRTQAHHSSHSISYLHKTRKEGRLRGQVPSRKHRTPALFSICPYPYLCWCRHSCPLPPLMYRACAGRSGCDVLAPCRYESDMAPLRLSRMWRKAWKLQPTRKSCGWLADLPRMADNHLGLLPRIRNVSRVPYGG